MDQITFIMKIWEAQENLVCENFDESTRNSFLLVTLDEGKKIFSQRLKDDAYVWRLGTDVGEGVKEGYHIVPAWVGEGSLGYAGQQLYFVPSSLGIAARRLDDFEGGMAACSAARLGQIADVAVLGDVRTRSQWQARRLKSDPSLEMRL
jgi:hypothetical protein